jgi:maltose O-acetyltransferase
VRVKGRDLTVGLALRLVLNEAWCWLEALVRWMPGRLGRLIRHFVYRVVVKGSGPLLLAEYAHVWEPWRMRCGRNVRFGRFNQINCVGGLEIGDDVMMGPFVVILTANHRHDESGIPMRVQGMTQAPVRIESDVWIGAQVVILPGVTIGRGAIVAAGAVVTRDVLPGSVVGGVPAKVIRQRGGPEVAEVEAGRTDGV